MRGQQRGGEHGGEKASNPCGSRRNPVLSASSVGSWDLAPWPDPGGPSHAALRERNQETAPGAVPVSCRMQKPYRQARASLRPFPISRALRAASPPFRETQFFQNVCRVRRALVRALRAVRSVSLSTWPCQENDKLRRVVGRSSASPMPRANSEKKGRAQGAASSTGRRCGEAQSAISRKTKLAENG